MSHDDFLNSIERFLNLSGMHATELGTRAAGSPNLIHRLRKGASCTMKTAQKVIDFIENAKLGRCKHCGSYLHKARKGDSAHA